jgi:hypothetical protein
MPRMGYDWYVNSGGRPRSVRGGKSVKLVRKDWTYFVQARCGKLVHVLLRMKHATHCEGCMK